MKDPYYKHRALVTDLGFWLDQLHRKEFPEKMVEDIGKRVAHHEAALGVDILMERAGYQAGLVVTETAEVIPLPASAEPVPVTAAA